MFPLVCLNIYSNVVLSDGRIAGEAGEDYHGYHHCMSVTGLWTSFHGVRLVHPMEHRSVCKTCRCFLATTVTMYLTECVIFW